MSTRRRDAIEAVCFKPTTGGFVFLAPRPWVFGRPRNYLVSGADKAAILAAMVPDVSRRRVVALIAGLVVAPVAWILGVAALLWAVTGDAEPTGRDLVLLALIGVVPVFAALYLALAWNCHAQLIHLAPIIARLNPTEERITSADMRAGMTRTMSFRTLLTVILVWGVSALISAFTLGMSTARHTLASASTVPVAINLILPLVLIAIYATMAVRKARGLEGGAER